MNCRICRGPLMLLGILGKLAWFRCRNCGMDQHQPASVLDDLDQDDE